MRNVGKAFSEMKKLLKENLEELKKNDVKLRRFCRRTVLAATDIERINKMDLGERENVEGMYQYLIQQIDIFVRGLYIVKDFPSKNKISNYLAFENEVDPIINALISFKKQLKLEQSKIKIMF